MIKTLGIYTQNFSLYHDIIKELKTRNLSYVVLTEPTDIPRKIGVILTTSMEKILFHRHQTIIVDSEEHISNAIDIALQLLKGKHHYHEVFIGIDPGEHPGIAIIGDGIVLQKKQIQTVDEIFEEIRNIHHIYPADDTTIRIGHGSILNRNRIINTLIPLRIPIEIVNETRSNPEEHHGRHHRDEHAAARIAMLGGGGRVSTKQPVRPSKGAIRNIQRQSRTVSQGKVSISSQQAEDVLLGKKTLQEALSEIDPGNKT